MQKKAKGDVAPLHQTIEVHELFIFPEAVKSPDLDTYLDKNHVILASCYKFALNFKEDLWFRWEVEKGDWFRVDPTEVLARNLKPLEHFNKVEIDGQFSPVSPEDFLQRLYPNERIYLTQGRPPYPHPAESISSDSTLAFIRYSKPDKRLECVFCKETDVGFDARVACIKPDEGKNGSELKKAQR